MHFKLYPLLDTMISFYQEPLHPDRFQKYLGLLQGGSSGDMELPIAGFNPMAKAHVLDQLQNFKVIEVEKIIDQSLRELNGHIQTRKFPLTSKTGKDFIQVVFCLSDDLKGGWTNHYTTDFDSKFKTNAFLMRDFCIAVFWTSEVVTPEVVRARTLAYGLRRIYMEGRDRLQTLAEVVSQENFVANEMKDLGISTKNKTATAQSILEEYYETYKEEEEINVLLNYLYGDQALSALGGAGLGIEQGYFS